MARRGVARAGAELTGGGQAAAATSALVLQASVSCSGKWDGATRPHVLGGLTELVRAKYFVSMKPDVWGNTNDVFLSPVLLLPPAITDKFSLRDKDRLNQGPKLGKDAGVCKPRLLNLSPETVSLGTQFGNGSL